MTLINTEKPSDIAIKKYQERLEHFLSGLHISAKVVMYDEPFERRVTINGFDVEHTMIWVKGVKISNQDVTDLLVTLHDRATVNETEIDLVVWDDAFKIQVALYNALGKKTGNPKEGDSFWKLWDFRP